MARNQVIEVHCDRCPRTEYLPAVTSEDDAERKLLDKTHFVAQFLGERIEFKDLCSSCRKAVGNYVKSIMKAKKEEEEAEAPSPTASTTAVSSPSAPAQEQPAASANGAAAGST